MPGYIEPAHMWMVIGVIVTWFVCKSFSVVVDEFAEWVRSKLQHRLSRQNPPPNSANASEARPDSPRHGRLTRLVANIIRRLPWRTTSRRPNRRPAEDIEGGQTAPSQVGDVSRGDSIPLQNVPGQQDGRRTSQPGTGAGAGDSNAVTTGLPGVASAEREGSQIDGPSNDLSDM